MKTFLTIGIASIALLFSQSALNAQTVNDFDITLSDLEFGAVPLGTTETEIVTIDNTFGTEVLEVTSSVAGTVGFRPAIEVGGQFIFPGEVGLVVVEFEPTTPGEVSDVLTVLVNAEPFEVLLFGEGGAAADPSALVDMILMFFNDSVADGTLMGRGSGWRSQLRIRAMRNRIRAIGFLLDRGYYVWAGRLARTTILRSDGMNGPRDFVDGPATEELNEWLITLEMLIDS